MTVNIAQLTSANSISGGSAYCYSAEPPVGMPQSMFGTDTAMVQYTLYLSSIDVPRNCTFNTLAFLNGSFINSGGAHQVVLSLYTMAGFVIARTNTNGTSQAGLNLFQEMTVLSGPFRLSKGRYLFGIVSTGGVSSRIRTIPANLSGNTAVPAATNPYGVVTGSIAAYETATPLSTPAPFWAIPSTFTADVGPVAYIKVA